MTPSSRKGDFPEIDPHLIDLECEALVSLRSHPETSHTLACVVLYMLCKLFGAGQVAYSFCWKYQGLLVFSHLPHLFQFFCRYWIFPSCFVLVDDPIDDGTRIGIVFSHLGDSKFLQVCVNPE